MFVVVCEVDVVVGYKYYFCFICDFVCLDVECIDIGMKCECVCVE